MHALLITPTGFISVSQIGDQVDWLVPRRTPPSNDLDGTIGRSREQHLLPHLFAASMNLYRAGLSISSRWNSCGVMPCVGNISLSAPRHGTPKSSKKRDCSTSTGVQMLKSAFWGRLSRSDFSMGCPKRFECHENAVVRLAVEAILVEERAPQRQGCSMAIS